MVRMVPDRTGRFPERPHYRPEELDRECEHIISTFLRDLYGTIKFPVETDDLTKLIEREADALDMYADLSGLGPDVEGVTEFRPGQRPVVRIAAELSNDDRRENRLRTTLTHEFGHLQFHAYLWATRPAGDLFNPHAQAEPSHCKRDTMLGAPQTDWMEWQAGYVCGALLMPVSHFGRCVTAYKECHGLFGPVPAASDHGRALIAAVVEDFQVSQDAARIRLIKLGHLGFSQHSSLFSS